MKELLHRVAVMIGAIRPFAAKVVSVDEASGTCEVDAGDRIVPREIRLMGLSDAGLTAVPAIGSQVQVAMLSPGIGQICWMSDCDKIIGSAAVSIMLKTDGAISVEAQSAEVKAQSVAVKGTRINLDANAITMNNGTQGPLVVLAAVVAELAQCKLAINSLATAYSAHTHNALGSDVVSNPSAATTIPMPIVLPPPDPVTLSNPKITHG